MEHFIPITILNDFMFCPYSIYLHQIYDVNQEDVYHSFYQSRGKRLHDFVQNDIQSHNLRNAWVVSECLGVYGRIDEYIKSNQELIEYKSSVAVAYKGYYYQIWAQYICLTEMGLTVNNLAFYDFKTKSKMPIHLPTRENLTELRQHIQKVKHFDFNLEIQVNENKCRKCIYNNLCEKTSEE